MPEQATYLENTTLGIGVALAVMVMYFVVAFIAQRATTNEADLYVAGRSIGPIVNSLAAAATWMSVATFLGVVALIQQLHMPFVYMWSQLILSVPLLVLFYGAMLRRLGSYSSVSFVRGRYGDAAAYVASVWMLLILLMYMVGQMTGTAKIFEVLLGLDYITSLIISAVVITVYITLGGMKGATYNDAIQMVIMLLTFIVPLAAILKVLGADAWWFPPLGYGNMVDTMLTRIPVFFDLKFDPRFYLGLFVALTLGILGLPHLAQRVLTSSSVKTARSLVPWFCFWVGLMFTATYAMGFAGVFHYAQPGNVLPPGGADKTTLLLNLAYNPEWVSALVIAGVLAAGISTIAGLMIGVATIVAHDLVGSLMPHLPDRRRMRWGYGAIFVTGIVSLLISLDPPAFLITSIFWAFGLCACTITPMVLLGAWSTRINATGAIVGSIVAGLVYIAVSPYWPFPSVFVGPAKMPVTNLGYAAALVAVPVGFILTVLVSLAAERVPALVSPKTRMGTQAWVEALHGWRDVTGDRYAAVPWLLILCALWVPVLIWGLAPWT